MGEKVLPNEWQFAGKKLHIIFYACNSGFTLASQVLEEKQDLFPEKDERIICAAFP